MDQILQPLWVIFQWQNFLLMLLGTLIGMVVGILPGIGALQAMALLIPLSWKMEVNEAFILLVSVYATSKFGGGLTAILFNVPGDAPNVVTMLDGYPMAKQGKAKTAIGISSTVSILGGIFAAVSVVIFLPLMYRIILMFGPAEAFMLSMFGLATISAISARSIGKGLIAACMGVLISTIGYHPMVGQARYTFGTMYLEDGIHLISLILGLLAMNEPITLWREKRSIAAEGVELLGSYREGIRIVFQNMGLFFRSSVIAWVIGVAPGAGAPVAGFVSYASAMKTCKKSETFGRGDPRGLIAADTGLHSCSGGDLLPTITIGVPGAASMAILLGAFALHGMSPGPQIIKFHLNLVYVILYTLIVAHCAAVGMALFFANAMERITKLQAEVISPVIIVFCLMGAYIVREYWQDMLVTTLFGILGYYMRKHGYNPIPMVMGAVLGPVAELNLFESLAVSDHGGWIFFTRTPSLIIGILTLVVIFWGQLEGLFRASRQEQAG